MCTHVDCVDTALVESLQHMSSRNIVKSTFLIKVIGYDGKLPFQPPYSPGAISYWLQTWQCKVSRLDAESGTYQTSLGLAPADKWAASTYQLNHWYGRRGIHWNFHSAGVGNASFYAWTSLCWWERAHSLRQQSLIPFPSCAGRRGAGMLQWKLRALTRAMHARSSQMQPTACPSAPTRTPVTPATAPAHMHIAAPAQP